MARIARVLSLPPLLKVQILSTLALLLVSFQGCGGPTSSTEMSNIEAQLAAGSSPKIRSKAELAGALTSAHNLLFGKDNVLVAVIGSADRDQWDQVISGISDFVKANASSFPQNLTSQRDLIISVGDNLIDVLQTNYVANIVSAIPAKADQLSGLSRIDSSKITLAALKANLADMDTALAALSANNALLMGAQTTLAGKGRSLVTQSAKDARDLLVQLDITLSVTISKVQSDYAKLKAAVLAAT